jgi:hypothetical protein
VSEAISRHKRLAMGRPMHNTYAKGGSVKPSVPEYADGVVADSRKPVGTTRAGNKANPIPSADIESKLTEKVAPLTKQSGRKK